MDFVAIRQCAANLTSGTGIYTPEQFLSDYPQFTREDGTTSLVPVSMLEQFVEMANAAIQPDRWQESWRYGVGLYVAHHAALYLSTYQESSQTAKEAAALGKPVGAVKSATLGDSSVTYDTDTLTTATGDWGDLNATTYGQMLANRAKLVGMGGSYVI